MPPFDNVRVRQALNYAVDKEAINKALFQGLAVPMNVAAAGFAQWRLPSVSSQPYNYDPEKAKKLLAEAGLKTRFRSSC